MKHESCVVNDGFFARFKDVSVLLLSAMAKEKDASDSTFCIFASVSVHTFGETMKVSY